MGRVRFCRSAVASSPHVIWKQPSPIKQTTGRSGWASFAAIAPGRPKPIDDQPLVIRKLRGACTVHWLAIWCVWAPTSKDKIPSFGSAVRTRSMAACGVKLSLTGRSDAWKASRWPATSESVQSLSAALAKLSRVRVESRLPVTSKATETEASVSTGSMSICSKGTLPIQASYSTSIVSYPRTIIRSALRKKARCTWRLPRSMQPIESG